MRDQLREDDPQPRPPIRDASEPVEVLTHDMIAAGVRAMLARSGGGRLAEHAAAVQAREPERIAAPVIAPVVAPAPAEPSESETIATIRRIAAGGKYVSVAKLIEALRA